VIGSTPRRARLRRVVANAVSPGGKSASAVFAEVES
jgi:hypothetical protein